MALEGTLKDVGLSDIFQLLSLQKKTGILTIFRAKDVVTVSFEKGQVVFADEFQRSEQERLGAVLLKGKLITPHDLLKAVEMQKQTLQKLGFILVNNNFLNPEDLKRALQMQVRETVFKLFRWEDGNFKFSQEPVDYDQSIYQALPSDFLVMEGIRRIDEWPLIKKKISSMDIIFDHTETARDKIEDSSGEGEEEDLDDILSFVDEGGADKSPREDKCGLKLSSTERVIFSLLDGHRTVEIIIDEGRMGEFETCKALLSLLSLGLIKKVAEATKPVEEKTGGAKSLLLKKIVAGLVVLVVSLAVFSISPVGIVRTLPKARDSMENAGYIGDKLREDKIKFALLCYFLESNNYPSTLDELVQVDLVDRRDIYDHKGEEFTYLREQSGYSLRSEASLTGNSGPDR